jgi:molybdate-binding protein/DNA-binding XRE family transcriptional regulator
MDIENHLAELRAKRGFGAAQLAAIIGVSRQTIYAIEAGTYVPNTAVSLKLAQVLETTVEGLFEIEAESESPEENVEAIVLGDVQSMALGQPLRLCGVNHHLVAVMQEPGNWGLPPADAVLLSPPRSDKRNAKAKVRVLGDGWMKSERVLISGCDPSVSFLERALQPLGCELVIVHENSSRSLELLHEGLVHVAGSHLVDKVTHKTDLLPITAMFPRNSIAVFSYAVWQEGLVVAPGNPKKIDGIPDLSRKDVRITNREPGAGCRLLLDELLEQHGIAANQVNGYDQVTIGHIPATRLVRSGEVDCCVSTRVVAQALGLDFIPLAEKPYHLVIRRSHLELPAIQTLIETLSRTSFRREVEACTGYNLRTAGDRLI